MPEPILTPIAPTPGRPLVLGAESPVWIGSRVGGGIQVSLPGVGDRHLALVEREDGWWASAGQGATTVNDRPLTGSIRLHDGDVIQIAHGYQYRFTSGLVASPAETQPVAAPAPRARRSNRRRSRDPGDRPSLAVIAMALAVVATVIAAGFGAWTVVNHSRRSADILSDQQLVEFDSLMVVADDHVERGGALLELGLNTQALDEFASAVNTLAASDLRDHPEVRPRVGALEAAIAAIYRERHLAAPGAYAGKSSVLTADQQRTATLTVDQFARAFAEVAAAYQARFGQAIEVTGRDHAEHLALYGAGGALDLRARTMLPAEVAFVTAACRAWRIRVKDFSQDAVLQAEIKAANAAGQFDRAGTGLHLHIDRFGGRRDRWTVTLTSWAGPTAAGT